MFLDGKGGGSGGGPHLCGEEVGECRYLWAGCVGVDIFGTDFVMKGGGVAPGRGRVRASKWGGDERNVLVGVKNHYWRHAGV